ncbi:hypothetical protein QWY14_08180 [Planococcus sp. N028]|uniref:SWIM-type domain-containing protein n=1 Tax=Planococcus shixiaomingii TaxID=3058393 RepID=A0ABT8N1J3_9BACL|nr:MULTISPECIES: hypothetical protein [unclassified Planococcus (in: firmicutes)]MDN7241769.1 hypothetical protein [Planococcus sp. N028]WKA54054.1 hypothetical protein QWY21_15480 [Planococcus sp. N022]
MATVQSLAQRFDDTIHNYMAAIDKSLHPTRELDEEMVRKAVFLVRHDGVQIQTFNEEKLVLEAIVKDAHTVKVFLNFDKLTAICACPQEEMCRHRLAVIFALYQKIGSLTQWVADWRARPNDQLTLISDKRSPAQWNARIRNAWRDPVPDYTTRNYFYFEQMYEGRLKNALSFVPLEREWKVLYRTYAHFISLSEVWDTYISGSKEVHHSFFKTWFEDELHELNDLLGQLRTQRRTFESDAFFDYLRTMVRSFVNVKDGSFSQRFTLYQLFWTSLFINNKMRIEEAAAFSKPDERINAFFGILLNDSVNVTKISPDEAHDWIQLALLAESEKHSQALSAILMAVKPHVKTFLFEGLYTQYRQQHVRTLSRLFSLIHLSEADWEDLFKQFGHYGLPAYSTYLIEKKLYKQWAELHHLHNSPLYFVEECGLKEVQNAAPDYVLPLYHRYALAHLEERNRTSYKQAVRIWKKMKAACKKSGQMSFWEAYMNEIQTQNKRLRALQEEIEKGNLV